MLEQQIKEEWKDIPNYIGVYQASSLGRVRSLPRNANRTDGKKCNIKGRILKPALNKDGYYKCALCFNQVLKSYRVHKLVAQAFYGDYRKLGKVVNHKDGNKLNNNIDNLEIVTIRENVIHSFKNGLQIPLKGSQIWNSKLKEEDIPFVRMAFDYGWSSRRIARLFKMDKSVFLSIKNGRLWKHV